MPRDGEVGKITNKRVCKNDAVDTLLLLLLETKDNRSR